MSVPPQLKCGILMDITGSMGPAWRGVKDSVIKFPNIFTLEVGDTSINGVKLYVALNENPGKLD